MSDSPSDPAPASSASATATAGASARVLTGLQPSGQLHLGNYAGAIQQLLAMQEAHAGNLYVFVASYHALTTIQDAQALAANTRQVVIDYLAFGLDPAKCHIYRQQDVPQVTELAWMLSCVFPKSRLELGTSYKDKTDRGLPASTGLFTYPMLQAADILAVDSDVVPVGKDQQQNVEFARDVAGRFNHAFNAQVFKEPDVMLRADAAVLPGLDGQKMSKSYGNTIDPFLPEKKLRKRIMAVVSGSEALEDVKDPEQDTTFQIFRGLAGADDERTQDLAAKYRAGGFGYGHAKQALFELILDQFGEARTRREALMNDPGAIDEALSSGAKAANAIIGEVTARARKAVGL